MTNTITPKANPSPTINLSDEEISRRVNDAITTARAAKTGYAYVDLGLDLVSAPRDGGPLAQRVLSMLVEKGYHGATLDGRSCQIEIPL